MDLFFMANLIIAAGGIFALLTWKQFNLMKIISVAVVASGCGIGCFDALSKLMKPGGFTAAVDFLNTASITFRIDNLSAFFLVAIYAISMLAVIYSFHYLDKPEKSLHVAVNNFFFSLLIISMALVVTAGNILTFMLAWESMSLSSFFLVIYDYQSAENRQAGFLYFVFSHVGAMFILAGFGLLFGHTGRLEFTAISLNTSVKTMAFVLCFIGFGSKAGIFPFHIWLPHAHPAAPSHISAVMSGVMIKTGIYGILRIYRVLELQSLMLGEMVLVTGIVSGILGVVYALGQNDLKRLLAYCSVENIGIILIGVGIGMIGAATGQPVMAVLGFSGGLLHVWNHSVFKSLLFMSAGMVIKRTGTRSISTLGGLIKNMPITGATCLIGSVAICGLPPLNGFVSEFLIYLGSFQGIDLQHTALVMSVLAIISLAVIGGLALATFSKMIGIVFQGEPRTAAAANAEEKGGMMLPPLVVLAAICGIIGLLPCAFVHLTVRTLDSLVWGSGQIILEPYLTITTHISLAAAMFFGLVALIVVLRLVSYKGKSIGHAGTWGCGFTQPTVKMQYTSYSYAASILAFFKPVAPQIENHPVIEGRFPDKTIYENRLEDIAELHLETVITRPILWLFDQLRWIQHGDIHLYIGYILLAIVVLLFFM